MPSSVEDIRFVRKDGTPFGIDDFESRIRRAVLFDAILGVER